MASDHNLATGTVTLKLWTRQLDSKRLKNDEVKTAFGLELRNRFSTLEEEQEINISNFNQPIREAGVKVLGYKTKKKKEWMKQDTWTKISERKETKQKINATRSQRLKDRVKSRYAELNREVKRMAKADKKSFMEELAEEADGAARKHDL